MIEFKFIAQCLDSMHQASTSWLFIVNNNEFKFIAQCLDSMHQASTNCLFIVNNELNVSSIKRKLLSPCTVCCTVWSLYYCTTGLGFPAPSIWSVCYAQLLLHWPTLMAFAAMFCATLILTPLSQIFLANVVVVARRAKSGVIQLFKSYIAWRLIS